MQQGCIKLIRIASKDIIVSQNIYNFRAFECSIHQTNPESKEIYFGYIAVFNIANTKKCFLSTKSSYSDEF